MKSMTSIIPGLVSSLPPTPEELGKDAFVAICKVLLDQGWAICSVTTS